MGGDEQERERGADTPVNKFSHSVWRKIMQRKFIFLKGENRNVAKFTNAEVKPLTCPKCRSAFWDTPRRRKQK